MSLFPLMCADLRAWK